MHNGEGSHSTGQMLSHSRRKPWRCPPGSGGALTERVSHPAQQLLVGNRTGVFCVRGYCNRSPGMPHKWKTWRNLQVSKLPRQECWSKFFWLHSPCTVPRPADFPGRVAQSPFLFIYSLYVCVYVCDMFRYTCACMHVAARGQPQILCLRICLLVCVLRQGLLLIQGLLFRTALVPTPRTGMASKSPC